MPLQRPIPSTLPSAAPWLDALIDRFDLAWQSDQRPALVDFAPTQHERRRAALLALVPIDLEYRWRTADKFDRVSASVDETDRPLDRDAVGPRPLLDDYVRTFPELGSLDALPTDLIAWEYRTRQRWGDRPEIDEYRRRFPERGEELTVVLSNVDRELAGMEAASGGRAAARVGRALADAKTLVPEEDAMQAPKPRAHAAGSSDTLAADTCVSAEMPERLGRYQVTEVLGRGGYGIVYRGYDPELRRDVAIKVPRAEIVKSPTDAETYLTEARVLARLDHAGIVPVHDAGRSDDGLCYVVSKFIAGGDLANLIKQRRPDHAEAVELLAQISDALHYAHQRGLVHRDIKPANILIDEGARPLVADFGLALSDEGWGAGSTFCGTPAYMSPEQARDEGHRVDARSDIYSLGVIFYELLAGRRPYRHEMPALLDEITDGEIRPPRQLDHTIPKELERICLKALAKRAADRYTTAFDLAEDLRHWRAKRRKKALGDRRARGQVTEDRLQGTGPVPAPATAGDSDPLHTPGSAPPAPKVVPKGLRSFDAHDADFFLQLLPGPTDREGLPDGIRFWKSRVEQIDADQTFAVGLIYEPSGCGKSSLVKAGLLPRLAPHVTSVYLEATPDETEARLLKLLRKVAGIRRMPSLDAGEGFLPPAESTSPSAGGAPTPQSLVEAVAALRRGKGLAAGQKVLIVLDQFEQWLHAHRDREGTELVRALRQCEGGHVQCVVMVRDDFWMAASRFLRELEIALVEGENSAATDLFSARHAKRVLLLFGRAFGCLGRGVGFQPAIPSERRQVGNLPHDEDELTPENEQFVDQAVAGLAEDGKVVSVRLALFAEMVKSKPWTPATLKEIGGIAGVGATFLEETFSASTAPRAAASGPRRAQGSFARGRHRHQGAPARRR